MSHLNSVFMQDRSRSSVPGGLKFGAIQQIEEFGAKKSAGLYPTSLPAIRVFAGRVPLLQSPHPSVLHDKLVDVIGELRSPWKSRSGSD